MRLSLYTLLTIFLLTGCRSDGLPYMRSNTDEVRASYFIHRYEMRDVMDGVLNDQAFIETNRFTDRYQSGNLEEEGIPTISPVTIDFRGNRAYTELYTTIHHSYHHFCRFKLQNDTLTFYLVQGKDIDGEYYRTDDYCKIGIHLYGDSLEKYKYFFDWGM